LNICIWFIILFPSRTIPFTKEYLIKNLILVESIFYL